MGFRSLKIFMMTLLAVIFGGMQFVCACEAAPVWEAQTHHSVENSHHNLDVAQDTRTSHASHASHEHSGDCENCDTRMIAASNIDNFNLVKAKLDISVALPISNKPDNRFSLLARLDLSGRRWLDPPKKTPVSLKIRLLT